MATVKELIKLECKACGPVTAQRLYDYVNEQHSEHVEPCEIAANMNTLLKNGTIEIYDIDDDGMPTFW